MTPLRRLVAALSAAAAIALAAGPAVATQRPVTVVAGVGFIANFAFAPDGRIFIADKDSGNVLIAENGHVLPQPFVHLDVVAAAEQGLLGIALDPAFPEQPWVYLYYSDAATHTNRLIRVRADGNTGIETQPLLDALTTENGYHNGGDIAFGTDGKLYLTIGEVHEADRAQDPTDLGGKVVRLNPDGSVPADNPFGASNPVYSIGHRNSFGLCVDPATGDLWETENGPSSDDEVNRIVAGANYGWPDQLGPGGGSGLTDPVLDFPREIVPTGCAVWNGALYFGSFAYGQLHRLPLPPTPAPDQVVREFPEGITDVETGPDGGLYVSTVSTIYRLAGDGTPIPTISTSQGPPPVAGPSDSGGGRAPLLAIVAAVALVIGLAMRVEAGRRLRRESRGP
jgi:aldose sugar dehydrogenase